MPHLATVTAQAAYLFAPMLAGTVVAGVVLRYDLMSGLARPIDGHARFRGRRLFGDNKTWRGLACALIGCIVAVATQRYAIGDRAGAIAVVDYGRVNVPVFAGAFAISMIAGELPNSFAKRQLGIAPGQGGTGIGTAVFYVVDQIDVLLFVWPILLFWIRPSWVLVAVSVALVFVVHQIVSAVGFVIGARTSMFH